MGKASKARGFFNTLLLQVTVPAQECGQTAIVSFILTARVVASTAITIDDLPVYGYILDTPHRFNTPNFSGIEKLELVCDYSETLLVIDYKVDMWKEATVRLQVSQVVALSNFLRPLQGVDAPPWLEGS